MTTLNQGQTAGLVLAVGDIYTVSSSGTATVRGIYGAPSATTTITAGFATFGPYSVPAKLDVVAVSGAAGYSLVDNQSLMLGGKYVALLAGTVAVIGQNNDGATMLRTSSNSATDSTYQTIWSTTVPGSAMGDHGSLRMTAKVDVPNSASTKAFRWVIGGTQVSFEPTATTSRTMAYMLEWYNKGAQNSNGYFSSGVINSVSGVADIATAIDTSVDFTLELQVRWTAAASAETIRCYRALVEVLPG